MSSTGSDFGKGDPAATGHEGPGLLNQSPVGPAQGPRALPHRLKNPAVLCDFDDTTAVENVAELLLDHFSEDGAWRGLRRQAQESLISFREYQQRAFEGTGAGRDEMKAVVKAKATLRPCFKELWEYCRAREVPLAIVTVGLDFYVDALLEREGLEDVPRYAVTTRFNHQGISFEYPYPWEGSGGSDREVCLRWGSCKCRVLEGYAKQGHSLVYVGDGRSDYCPATIADLVFARGQLAQLCRENEVEYLEFEDFGDVIEALRGAEDPDVVRGVRGGQG